MSSTESGTTFGPELSKIGDKLSKAGLYESILDPVRRHLAQTLSLLHF